MQQIERNGVGHLGKALSHHALFARRGGPVLRHRFGLVERLQEMDRQLQRERVVPPPHSVLSADSSSAVHNE